MSEYATELQVAKQAAESATEIIQRYQRERNFTIDLKGKNDLVTEADVSAEKEILSVIKKEFPDDQVLAEETEQGNSMPEGRTWLIDPIDGTTNFAHGFPPYCVSIAFWEDYQPRVGLVSEVAHGELFTAMGGEGAFLDGDPISISAVEDAKNALIGTGFPYNNLGLVDHYLDFFRFLMGNTHGVRRPGSAAYDLCCLACGRYDGFYEYGLSPWDVGAGALIVQEAGGIVSDWEGDDEWLMGERIIAGTPAVHRFLLEEIRNHFEEDEVKSRK